MVAGGSDSSGYLNSARLLASGRLQTELRTPAEFTPLAESERLRFIPQGFWPHRDTTLLSPTYPTGLPLHYALAGKILGWTAGPFFVVVVMALASVCLCYAVGRELGLDPWLAAAGAVTLALFPVSLFATIQPLSDGPATTWVLAAIFAALRSQRHRAWSAACGVATGIAVLVRPTNIVLLPALVVLLGLDWRRLALAILGGLPALAWLLLYNRTLYGAALASGYGDWKAAFALRYGWPTLAHFARWLGAFLPVILGSLPFAALAFRYFQPRALLALFLWFGAIAGLYAFYEVSHEAWWCLRFILPAVPALILLGLLGLETLLRRLGSIGPTKTRGAVALALMALAVVGGVFWTKRQTILLTKGYEQVYADASAAAREKFPAGTLVISHYISGALYFYTDFAVLRWDQIDAAQFARYAAFAQQAGRTIGAVVYQMEEEAFRTRCPGNWERVASVKNVGLFRLIPDAKK